MIDTVSGTGIVFNGEIYNFRELRGSLDDVGIGLRSGSDTEVILQLFLRHGPAAFLLLEGMFAIGIWNPRRGELVLARDRLGVKPLYVGHVGDSLVFDSELKSVRCITGFDRAVDREALALFMRHDSVPAPYSIYASVGKLLPGTLARSRDAWRQPADELPGGG